jgi:glycosyltransferase involved in cell wall biosynthesis
MKVLFSLTYYTPYISGLTIYVARVAKELTKNSIDVTILTSQHDKELPCYPESERAQRVEDERSPHVKDGFRVGGLHIIRVPYLFKISKGFIMPNYVWESFKAVKNNDVVFVNLPQVEGFIVAFWARLLHKKIYSIYHCDLILPKGFLNLLINNIVTFCNFITLKLSEKIIVFTNEYAETSPHLLSVIPAKAGTQKEKLIQILPPISPLSVDGKYLSQLEKDFSISGEFKLGFVGRIAEEKGLEYLISAVKNIDGAKLFIVGPKEKVVGEEKYIKKINKLLEENTEKIIFLGKLNESQMGAFYKFINLLVVASVNRTEAFGLVQAEAMFAGCPVVTTDLPGVKFLVESTGAGEIAKKQNSENLKEKILVIKNNYKFYQAKTKNILNYINVESTIKQFVRLINK